MKTVERKVLSLPTIAQGSPYGMLLGRLYAPIPIAQGSLRAHQIYNPLFLHLILIHFFLFKALTFKKIYKTFVHYIYIIITIVTFGIYNYFLSRGMKDVVLNGYKVYQI